MGFSFRDRISTYPNRYKLNKADGTSEYVTLERADSPTQVGTPLNADTFNAAFAEKAPAGYGLGGYGKYIDASASLDNLRSFGAFYWTSSLPINAPAEWCTMLVVPMPDHIFQIIMPFGKRGCIITRTMIGNDAIVEWMNPPMIPGVEYRTMKRHNGKPVYAYMSYDMGGLSANPTTDFEIRDSGLIDEVVSCSGWVWVYDSLKYAFPFIYDGNANSIAFCSCAPNGKVTVLCQSGNLSAYTHSRFMIEYTKNTDG